MPIHPQIVSYYLSLSTDSEISEESIKSRLLLETVNDDSAEPLSQKIIENPNLIEKIKSWIRPEKAYMRCIISTPLEAKLAETFGIPLRANPPELTHLGTKQGSRNIFKEAQVR